MHATCETQSARLGRPRGRYVGSDSSLARVEHLRFYHHLAANAERLLGGCVTAGLDDAGRRRRQRCRRVVIRPPTRQIMAALREQLVKPWHRPLDFTITPTNLSMTKRTKVGPSFANCSRSQFLNRLVCDIGRPRPVVMPSWALPRIPRTWERSRAWLGPCEILDTTGISYLVFILTSPKKRRII